MKATKSHIVHGRPGRAGLLVIVSLVLAACTLPPVFVTEGSAAAPRLPAAAAPEATVAPQSIYEASEAVADLMTALEEGGAAVQWAGTVNAPFFAVPGWLMRVDGHEVQAFEYLDEQSRINDTVRIAADGSEVGSSMVQWAGQPNFWAEGELIVLYVGDDAGALAALGKVLGDPLTKPGAGTGPAIPLTPTPEAAAAEPTPDAAMLEATAAPAPSEPAAEPTAEAAVIEATAAPAPPEGEIPVLETNVTLVQAVQDVKIHEGPSADYKAIGDVFAGNQAKVTGISADGAWWRVICPDDTEGSCWVSGDMKLTTPVSAE